MKRIHSKVQLELIICVKFHCLVLMIKDDGVNSLAYFHKDIKY